MPVSHARLCIKIHFNSQIYFNSWSRCWLHVTYLKFAHPLHICYLAHPFLLKQTLSLRKLNSVLHTNMWHYVWTYFLVLPGSWWKYGGYMGGGGKYEKLDVGSFTVAKCNDAFTAGPHDDNWNTKHHSVIANADLDFANIMLIVYNSQFELTLVSLCFAHTVFTWRRRCWRNGMSMFALVLKIQWSKQFLEDTF